MKCPHCRTENPETARLCGNCAAPLPVAKSARPEVTETLHTPIRELATGSMFAGRYQIIEELGRGGMGRVYKVFDTDIKEKIALKLLRPEIALDTETVERFSNELKLARKIRHKNICGMFDLGKAEGTTFITMEYVAGEDLKKFIRKSGQLGAGRAVSIARQVCEGLAEAHRLGIVHRDLKPQNVMPDEDGNARIMDFGIARSLSSKSITGAGVMIGTPEYMSPEQVEGKDVDPRSDLYSLGIILYEMLAGRVPFEGDAPFTVAVKHKSKPPKDPKLFNPNIPDSLSAVILKCLEKDREKRYPSAAGVRTDLDRIEQGLPTTERLVPKEKPFPSKEITVKFQPKKLIAPILAALVLVVAAVIFWPKRASNLDPKLVAVSIFENKTGDPKLDNTGSLAAERIMQGLTQVGGFIVAPMQPAEALAAAARGRDKLRTLAGVTKAGKIVHGDYYLQGENIQFHAWVEDMVTRKNILALEPASGSLKDVAATLEPQRLKLMGGLAGVFEPAVNEFLPFMKEPPNYEAYREYMEGMRSFTRREYPKAVEHMLREAKNDPNFRSVWIVASIACNNQGQFAKAEELARDVEKSRADLSTGERLSLDHVKAILHGDLDTQLRTARQIASSLKGWIWNYENALCAEANDYPREAVDLLSQLDPYDETYKDWSTNYWGVLRWSYHMLGDHKRELKAARRGRKQFPERRSMLFAEVDALSALGRVKDLQNLFEESESLPPQGEYIPGYIMLDAGRELRAHGFKDNAVRVLNQALQWFEGRPAQEKASERSRSDRAVTLYVLGRWADAKEIFEGLHVQIPDDIDYLGYLGAFAARMGDRDSALKIARQLEEDQRPYLFGNPTYWRVRITALLGDKEGAVDLLRQATKQGFAYSSIHPTEDFESLADSPPYVQLMKPKG